MLESLEGFAWDLNNVEHILAHGVLPNEVEEAVIAKSVIIPAKAIRGEARWKLFGRSREGRFLTVVFTIRGNQFRTVTAYTMNRIERRLYAKQIES